MPSQELQALVSQAQKVTLTSRAFRNDQLALLYKELHELKGMELVLPMNSGAEAVETAIKAARKLGHRVKGIPNDPAEIIVCSNNFHGRAVTIVSFSTDERYRDSKGLWIGIELEKPARPFCEALQRQGVLCKETHDRVIRIALPFVITREEIDWAVERIDHVISAH